MGESAQPAVRYTTRSYFGLVDAGILSPDDRVELLEGVIVTMSPQSPAHAATVNRVAEVLREAIARTVAIRVQSPLLVGQHSAPEPDVAVVPGRTSDYHTEHPSQALLVVEVAASSLQQDRLTKAQFCAAGGCAEYWVVNLTADQVEVFRDPDPPARRYRDASVCHRGDRIALGAVSGTLVAVNDLLPES